MAALVAVDDVWLMMFGTARPNAASAQERTNAISSVSDNSHATTRRENQSKNATKYKKPPRKRIYAQESITSYR